MKCISFALLMIGFVLILGVTEAAACICREPFNQKTTTEEKLNWYRSKAQTVILGKVVSEKYLSRPLGLNASEELGRRENIRVERFWGSSVSNEVFLIERLTSCDARLQVGKSYLIFVYETKGNKISTGACSGNLEVKYATEEIKLLGKGIKPKLKKSLRRRITRQSKIKKSLKNAGI